jgi:FAD/FMN-containing dehydrogenase
MNIGTDLRQNVRGRVLVAGDEAFETVGRPWNLAVEQPVVAVVEAADATDVAALVGYAGRNGLTVAAQPTGHGASGDTEGVILLRTGRLGGVAVSPEQRLAKVGAGVSWGEVLTETAPHGLTGLAGSSPVVSVTGYTLGGGLSWFGRKYGLAADSARAFDVVTADGARARVDATSDADLFWALRGGGGDFAVVTAMEFDLHPAPALHGGRMLWPAEQAEAVLTAFTEITADAPDELTVWYTLFQLPDVPQLPEPLRGLAAVVVDHTYLGDAVDGEALLRAFDKIDGRLLDTRRTVPVSDLGSITAEPTSPSAGMSRAELLTGLDNGAAATLLAAAAGTGTVAPLIAVQLRHLGGALSRPGAGPAGHFDEQYLLYAIGAPSTPEVAAAIRQRQTAISQAMAEQTTGRKPFNYLAPTETAAHAFPADALARLRDIKRHHDPHGVLRGNYPVLA